jgi:hypothetical protein
MYSRGNQVPGFGMAPHAPPSGGGGSYPPPPAGSPPPPPPGVKQ